MLIRSFSYALILVSIGIFVLYMNYLLVGQFFFCLFLAQITSIALRPYIDHVVDYSSKAVQTNGVFLLETSYVYLILKYIWKFIKVIVTQRDKFGRCCNKLTFRIREAYQAHKKEQENLKLTLFNS